MHGMQQLLMKDEEKQWGIDDEAAEALETRRLDFEFAYKFWKNAT